MKLNIEAAQRKQKKDYDCRHSRYRGTMYRKGKEENLTQSGCFGAIYNPGGLTTRHICCIIARGYLCEKKYWAYNLSLNTNHSNGKPTW